MPNQLTAQGLETATRDELVANFTASMQLIYGSSIDLSSSSPDGQMMNIFIQAVLDLQDLLAQIYNTFDPDNAIGVVLDQRVAINGIQRKAGTFSITNVTVTVSQSVNLYGLDQTDQPVYTVADNAGNQWQLQTTQLGITAGAHVLVFQAAVPGAVQSAPNTITVPVTIILGVSSINNPTTYTTLGINEETDAVLKVRRQQSVSLASQGYLSGLLAALENINGVTSAFVYENNTDSTDGDGVPSHSIWVIVAGSAAASDIAQAIYTKRNAGCGMFGTTTFNVTQVDGSVFTVKWDNVQAENLYVAFYCNSVDAVNPPNIAAIVAGLPAIFVPGVNAEVDITHLGTLIQDLDGNTYVTFAGSGTPATGGFSTAIGGTYTNTLTPNAKNKQFAVASARIVALYTQPSGAPSYPYNLLLSPYNPISQIPIAVLTTHTQQFTASGGYGAYTYSFVTNNSGGSIGSSSGLYTAGSTPGTDTIKVLDSLGNQGRAVITVS